MRILKTFLGVLAIGLLATHAHANVMLTVDDGSGSSTTITGNPGDTVTGLVVATSATVTDLTDVIVDMTLTPVGLAPATVIDSFAFDPGFWGSPAPNTITQGSAPLLPVGASRLNIGITTAGTAGVSANGTVYSFDVTIPLGASVGDMWTIALGPPGTGGNYGQVSTASNLAFASMMPGKITVVPEPSAFMFLGLCAGGGLAVTTIRRRRKAKQAETAEEDSAV